MNDEVATEFVSFTHETFAMHFGPGGYITISEDAEKVTGLHIGPAGVTHCAYMTDDPFESISARTLTWRSIQSFALETSADGGVFTLSSNDTNMEFGFEADTLSVGRNIHQMVIQGMANFL